MLCVWLTTWVLAATACFVAADLKPCIKNEPIPGQFECVCNSTYCSEWPSSGSFSRDQVAWYQSTASGKRFDLSFAPIRNTTVFNSTKAYRAVFHPSQKKQSILGFGGAFTDSFGINLFSLSSKSQEQLLQAYFGANGIGYTMGRVPVASCDMSTHIYSYDDHKGDLKLAHFALSKEDFLYKIPAIKRAREISNHSLKLFSSPWSAPGWMKANGKMIHYGFLKGSPGGPYYQAFAQYYLKFFLEYHRNGVDFWGLTVLNEPKDGGYEFQTMSLTPELSRDFIKKDLGPALKSSNVTNQLILMIHDDSRGYAYKSTNVIIGDPEAAKYVAGTAVHWYGDINTSPHVLTKIHDLYPEKFVFYTEACTYYGSKMRGEFSRALRYADDIIQILQHWGVGWMDWNMALNTGGGPSWVNNKLDAPILVNATADEFYLQPEFHAMGHFSKLIVRGSVKVGLNIVSPTGGGSDIKGVAFVTPTNQNVVVVVNKSTKRSHSVIVQTNETVAFEIKVEKASINTFLWQ